MIGLTLSAIANEFLKEQAKYCASSKVRSTFTMVFIINTWQGVFHLHHSVDGTTHRSDPGCAAVTDSGTNQTS